MDREISDLEYGIFSWPVRNGKLDLSIINVPDLIWSFHQFKQYKSLTQYKWNIKNMTFTKSLAQILSRDISFCDIVATRKGYFNAITLTIT